MSLHRPLIDKGALTLSMYVSVKAKIAGLAAGLILAMTVLAVLGISSLGKLDASAQESFETTTQPLAHLGTARAKANENRALLNNHILATTVEDKRAAQRAIRANDALIDRELDAVAPTIRTAGGRTALGELRAALAEYSRQRRETFAISNAGTDPATMLRAADHNATQVKPVFEGIATAFTALFDSKVKLGEAQNAAMSADYRSQRTRALILLGLAVVGGALASVWLARRITGGVGQMLAAAEGIAQGDLEQDVDIRSRDELGRTGEAFATMIDYLGETATAAQRIGQGDLSAELEPRSERDVLRLAFVDMRDNLRELVGELSRSAGTVSSASQQLSATSEETSRAVVEIATAIGGVAAGAEDQVRQVSSADEAIREVAQAAALSSRSAQAAAEMAGETQATVHEGVLAVNDASAAMEVVRANSAEAAAAIDELAGKSRRIGEFIETITGIAEQTNLLALNAAIEAARAGDQGRGFAVVADEVRQLAEDAGAAAEQIGGLVSEIQRETVRTVEVVRSGTARTEEGAETVERARQAFARIEQSVAQLASSSEEIAAAAEQIQARTSEVEAGIGSVARVAETSSATAEEVSAATEESSASAEEITASAQELSSTAAALEQLVGRFRLTR
jgi:methyl-accepting chemotaxis protein